MWYLNSGSGVCIDLHEIAIAHIQLYPPEPFNFRPPDDWCRWRCRFEQFRTASGLDKILRWSRSVPSSAACMGKRVIWFWLLSTLLLRRSVSTTQCAIWILQGQVKCHLWESQVQSKRPAWWRICRTALWLWGSDFRDDYFLVVGIHDDNVSKTLLQLDADLTLEKAQKNHSSMEIKPFTSSRRLSKMSLQATASLNKMKTGLRSSKKRQWICYRCGKCSHPWEHRWLGVRNVTSCQSVPFQDCGGRAWWKWHRSNNRFCIPWSRMSAGPKLSWKIILFLCGFETEFERMEDLGVISKVDAPTPQCVWMIAVAWIWTRVFGEKCTFWQKWMRC